MKRLRIRPAADADIDAAAFHYEREGGIDLAIEFYAAVENTWNMLLEQAHLGAVQEWLPGRLAGCCRWRVESPFQVYQVFYFPCDDGIEVLRVLHGARDLKCLFESEE